MKHSGELAKYGLAVINQLLEICGKDQYFISHDIGCTSRSTTAPSPLGPKAAELNLKAVVNAFHGFAHNRACQLENHSLYLQGLGNKNLETCERIFVSSNSTAALIHHASYFYWTQFLDLHFNQWDQDKYLELSKFLFNNYKQALDIISKWMDKLEEFVHVTRYTGVDFKAWHEEEKKYLKDYTNEPDKTTIVVEYVELLQKLQFAKATYGSITSVPFLTYTLANYIPNAGLNTTIQQCTNAVSAEFTTALHKYQLQLNAVLNFEKLHGISHHWTPDDLEYRALLAYVQHWEFICTVDECEGLVIQHLFKLAKANLTGTGYKMQKHISKALTRRSGAVCSTLDQYNKLAHCQTPPHPKLDYTQVISYATLGDFALLKHSHANLLAKPWSISANHEMATKYFKVLHLHEKIVCLGVEVRRLQAWVNFEDDAIRSAINKLKLDDPTYLVAEMENLYAERHHVNDIHCARLSKICALDGFSGMDASPSGHGRDSGRIPVSAEEVDDDDDFPNYEVVRLTDCLEQLS
ncbi:hypothetical protein J3R83DRAFT_7500 [Lanmaoa asiatica]|nr:hypothetical protein J3R83DRAFT_7500 [Lanmaoa asiatica]